MKPSKKIFGYLLFLFIANYSYSQDIFIQEIFPLSASNTDSVNVISLSYFPFGVDDLLVPSLVHYEYSHLESKVYLDLFFDISGAWPSMSSFRYDTINIGLYNVGSYSLIVSLHEIFEGEPRFYKAADTLSLSIVNTIKENYLGDELFTLYPNPANKEIFLNVNGGGIVTSLKLYTISGEMVQEFDPQQNRLDVKKLPSGLYIMNLIVDNKSIYQKCIIN